MLYRFILEDKVDEFDENWTSYQESIKDFPQEYLEKSHYNVIVNFDYNDEIVAVTVDIVCLAHDESTDKYKIQNVLMTFTKSDEPILEPDWVTEYKQAHA